MKSMAKILGRYVGSAAAITLTVLVLNLVLFFAWVVASRQEYGVRSDLLLVAENLEKEENGYRVSRDGEKAMDERYAWAMLLDDRGEILWSRKLPEELSKSYSVPETASFTRWYLKDYPVYVWRHPDGLLVLGLPKGSMWKMGMEVPQKIMEKTLLWIPLVLFLNGAAAVMLALLLGWRLFRSLRTLAEGVQKMAEKQPISLPVTGVLGDLAAQLNQTSFQLQKQEAALQKRDYARTSWIAGVSHDIRTPLSMVMGYASQLEENTQLPVEAREQAAMVRRQSERIKSFINDLNLASKLEYDMQPMGKEEVLLPALLRSVCADFLNGGLPSSCALELDIDPSAQNSRLVGDPGLLRRAVSNLIQNSVQYNPRGCVIQARLCIEADCCLLSVSDNGGGFSQKQLELLQNAVEQEQIPNHGLGLTIVRQIVKVHGGTAEFENIPQGGCRALLRFPCDPVSKSSGSL